VAFALAMTLLLPRANPAGAFSPVNDMDGERLEVFEGAL
jgi:hypothetical protein